MVKQSSKRSVKEAVELLKLVESQTSNLSEKDGDDEEVQDSVKKALCEFHGLIKKGKLDFLMQDIKTMSISWIVMLMISLQMN